MFQQQVFEEKNALFNELVTGDAWQNSEALFMIFADSRIDPHPVIQVNSSESAVFCDVVSVAAKLESVQLSLHTLNYYTGSVDVCWSHSEKRVC